MQADFTSTNHGTIVTLTAVTDAAFDWIADNMSGEDDGGDTINVEARYFFDIACGILNDGLRLMDAATGTLAQIPQED